MRTAGAILDTTHPETTSHSIVGPMIPELMLGCTENMIDAWNLLAIQLGKAGRTERPSLETFTGMPIEQISEFCSLLPHNPSTPERAQYASDILGSLIVGEMSQQSEKVGREMIDRVRKRRIYVPSVQCAILMASVQPKFIDDSVKLWLLFICTPKADREKQYIVSKMYDDEVFTLLVQWVARDDIPESTSEKSL